MPLLRVTHQRGRLSDSERDALAERLTAALLLGEAGADTPSGRGVAYMLFDEVDAARAWCVGGGASQTNKSAVHAASNTAVADVLGVDPRFSNRAGDWAMVRELADGAWGAHRQTIGIREINHLAGDDPNRADHFELLPAAQKRMRDAHGFPAHAPRA